MRETRAQAFTLEGVFAGLVVLAGVAFALQAAAVVPGASGGSSEPIDEGYLSDVLAEAADSGALERAVLYWSGGFHNANPKDYYTDGLPTNGFGTRLDESLDDTHAINVIVSHRTANGAIERQRMVYQGAPGEDSVRAATTVAIYDDDVLYNSAGNPTSTTVDPSNFYAEDESPTGLYNVFEVEVIVWRA